MASITFKGEKLIGKSNYIEWLIDAKLFLEINGYMPYINKTEAVPDKALYYNDARPKSNELAVKFYEKEGDET